MTINAHLFYQALTIIAHCINLFSGLVPPKYQAFVALALAIVNAGLAWYNHYYNPDGTPATVAFVAKVLLLALLFSSPLMAQTATDKTPLFSVSTQAVAVRIGGSTQPGTDAIGTLTLVDSSKIGMIQVQSDNILVPAINLQSYLGGVKAYPEFLSKPFEKTTLSSVKPYVHLALGIVRNVPAVGDAKQHYSALAGGGFDYKVNNTFSFGPRVEFFDAPGFGRSPHGAAVSANLTVVLGSK